MLAEPNCTSFERAETVSAAVCGAAVVASLTAIAFIATVAFVAIVRPPGWPLIRLLCVQRSLFTRYVRSLGAPTVTNPAQNVKAERETDLPITRHPRR